MLLTKSKYVEFALCPRKAWCELYAPIPITKEESQRQKDGNKAGLLARDYFGEGKCVGANQQNPQKIPGIYAEYPLDFGTIGCFCDLLRINGDGSIDIYEVKAVNDIYASSAKKSVHPKFLEDVSFQYYVAYKLNLNIRSVNLMYFNSDYVYDGVKLEINKLFLIKDMTEVVEQRLSYVENKIDEYFKLDPLKAPNCKFSGVCKLYDDACQYLDECKKFKGLPEVNSAYNLYRCGKKSDYIDEGYKSFEQIRNSKHWDKLSTFNKLMVNTQLDDLPTYVDKEGLKRFLSHIKFPIFFFDFETCQEVFPKYKNSRPYSQIPFQYSLHVLRKPTLDEAEACKEHKEFLGNGHDDPREDLIKQMLVDLEEEGSIIAYHASFERDRITDLARDFPKYAKELTRLTGRFIDLEDVFHYKEGDDESKVLLYTKAMENSCSIKHVLPAFFPGREDLNYKNLDQVHHGGEAIEAYKKLAKLTGKERDELRENMLKYCCLDTKAMVVLYLKYVDLTK